MFSILSYIFLINNILIIFPQNKDIERENEIATKLVAETNQVLNPVVESKYL